VHPPKRGRFGARPLVHLGFNKSWTRNSLNVRVVNRVMEIIRSPDVDSDKVIVYITGACFPQMLIGFCDLRISQHLVCD
jgi:hypothetical protein